mmetsp:Transcript_38825/g.83649  ORF Transcript_38825/g.83649 Transcript_38825/m.83649 type:complete len:352 (+) Transcript_38825:520-1575(+)
MNRPHMSHQHPNPNSDANAFDIQAETEKVKRRISEASSGFDLSELRITELDLRQDYENAIKCLIQCESLIGTLHDQLASKDNQIATLKETIERISPEPLQERLISQSDEIARLEDKLVQMSLDLASTKTREDELQHQLKTSFTSISPSISDVISQSCNIPSTVESKYWPISTSNRRSTHVGGRRSQSRFGSCWRGSDNQLSDCSPKTSFTAATSPVTSAKISFASIESGRQGWALEEPIGMSKLSSFGQFFLKNRSIKDCQQVQAQDTETVEAAKAERRTNNDFELALRRPASSKRVQLGKSSRSFLETRGVIFPVSSFEVISKGCVDRVGINQNAVGCNEGSKNEEWPVL